MNFYDEDSEELFPEQDIKILFVGKLFCVASLLNEEPAGLVALFIEDDGNYFIIKTFHKDWLGDLAITARLASLVSQNIDLDGLLSYPEWSD